MGNQNKNFLYDFSKMEPLAQTEGQLALFPKKPARAGASGKPLKLYSNYFKIDFDSKDIQGVNKYTLKFEPEIPDNSRKTRKEILRVVRDKVKEKLDFFIEWVQLMESCDKDHCNFLKIFFNSMMRSLRFEQIGPKSFNPAKAHTLAAHNVKVWPGFDARMIMKEQGALLNVDVAFRVVRTDSLLDYMNQVRDKAEQRNKDWQEALEDAIVGSTVVTRYNQKTYRVERIDFSMSPETTFDKEGTQVSYAQYYKEKYQENINDSNQPLLINKDRKTGVEIALIPELCQLTGLTEGMRADFRLMKDLAQICHTNAEKKINECKGLFQTFAQTEKCKQKQKDWHLKFVDTPSQIQGYKYQAGNMIMGPTPSGAPNQFDIERSARDLERKVQAKMFTQPPMKKWGIFHGDRDAQTANQFKSTMKQCLDQVGFEADDPAMYSVRPGMKADAWIRELKKHLNDDIQMVVLILPGQKGKNPL